ncbi:MAG TPA: DUF5110 domain-containing protein, partial [Verrucomicrobiae bacterium]|nr:DUF5110 domain-containing protein [Verrucomicrobiae bacterium]
IIPLDPVRQYVAAPVTGPTTLRIFPGADGDFTLYDDDGESQGYLSGKDRRTVWIRFRWKDAERRLVLEPDPRMKRWPGGARSFAVEIVGAGRGPANVQFRGQRMEVQL